jgi:hypothetical protein
LIQFTTEERPVTDSETVTDGDFVSLQQGGTVEAAANTEKLYGVVNGGSNSDLVSRNYREPETTGDSAGDAKVLVELAEEARFEIDVDADLASDAEGSYYTITGATGAQTVANASKSATVGQLLCLKRIPTNAAETEFQRGLFQVVALPSQTTLS